MDLFVLWEYRHGTGSGFYVPGRIFVPCLCPFEFSGTTELFCPRPNYVESLKKFTIKETLET